MHYSNFDNTIIDAIYELMLRYFQNNVSYHLLYTDMYNKNWKYDNIGRVIYNHITVDDGKNYDEIEITIGISKNFDSYIISSDARGGCSFTVRSKANSLGTMVDEISTDILNIEDSLIKEIENGFLI